MGSWPTARTAWLTDAVHRQRLEDDAGHHHDRQEVRQVRDRLHEALQRAGTHLVEQQREDDRQRETEQQGQRAEHQRVGEHLPERRVVQEQLEVVRYPATPHRRGCRRARTCGRRSRCRPSAGTGRSRRTSAAAAPVSTAASPGAALCARNGGAVAAGRASRAGVPRAGIPAAHRPAFGCSCHSFTSARGVSSAHFRTPPRRMLSEIFPKRSAVSGNLDVPFSSVKPKSAEVRTRHHQAHVEKC